MTTMYREGAVPAGPSGWLVIPGAPFEEPVFLENTGHSKVMIGPNGYGKSRLLRAIRRPDTPRVFRSLPQRLHAYAELACEQPGSANAGPRELRALAEQLTLARTRSPAWRDLAGSTADPLWLVGRGGYQETATVELIDRAAGWEPRWSFRVPAEQAQFVVERWTSPDEMAQTDLAELTATSFVQWSRAILGLTDMNLLPARNALVARSPEGKSYSLLELAETFCGLVCRRASERLRRLAGFTVEMRSEPEEGFAWSLRLTSGWFGIDGASTAIRRWVGLSVAETLREFGMVASDGTAPLEGTEKVEDILRGELPDVVIPLGEAQPFSTRSSWVAMDEPEIHLFGSEALQLGDTLADYSKSGRLMVVTHSLELASRMLGTCDFLTFHGPGEFTGSPPDSQVTQLLSRLAPHGIGILASTRILYVEGYWDIQVLQLFFGEELSQRNVVLSPMHGVDGASVVVSSVWQRMARAHFGVMFDRIREGEAAQQWNQVLTEVKRGGRAAEVRRLRRRARETTSGHEHVALLQLMANVIEGNMEDRVHFVMHGLSDIWQVCHPSLFGASGRSWKDEGYIAGSFKEFCKKRYTADLASSSEGPRLLRALTADRSAVDDDAYAALSAAVENFLASSQAQPGGC